MEIATDRTVKNDVEGAAKTNALQNEAARELSSRLQISGDRAQLLDTTRSQTVGTRIGETDPNAEMTATIMVRSKASTREIDEAVQKVVSHQRDAFNAKDFNDKFGADPQSMERVQKFAKDNGLTIAQADLDSGRVVLKGKVGDFSNAFKVHLDDYKCDDGIARERTGTISVPTEIGTDVQAVLGLDTRPHARALFQKQETHMQFAPRAVSGFLPTQVADAYEFPKESMGGGQSVGIIELGGGLDLDDNAKYYQEHGLKLPNIQVVGLDGANNTTGSDADGEVALDSQVIGAVAPDANQQLIFAPPSDQGFVDAVTRATFAQEGEKQNSAISISWGGRESTWDAQAIKSMDLAFKKAALKGISVFAAAGDTGAGDLQRGQKDDGKFVADYPASDPWVTATGGTRLVIDADGHPKEVTWNDNKNSSTGGGVSQVFDLPDFQKGVNVPTNPHPADGSGPKTGRGVPDVAGDASPATGYQVRVGGEDQVIGGTSAVAPLYAALMMRVNASLGKPAGFLNPFLYEHGSSGIFNDITRGNNNGFNAGPGWDAVTGWGSIRGTEFLNQLRKQLNTNQPTA